MKKFRHLNVPSHWEHYWSKYPEGYTIMEALLNWVTDVDKLTDNVNNWNEYLDEFVRTFDKNLQDKVIETLREWQADGTLDIIIDEALQTQIDTLENTVHEIAVNIKTAGAVGDGVTDNSAVFQRELTTGNKNIFIPEGDYVIADTIALPSNVTILGKGTIIDQSPANLFEATDKENIHIKVNVKGQGANTTYEEGKRLIYFNECKNVSVKDSKLTDYDGVSVIGLRRCDYFSIAGNTIDKYSYSGVALLDGCRYGHVNDNNVLRCMNNTSPNTYPIMLSGYDAEGRVGKRYAEFITCDGNYIDNDFPWWEGIDAHGGKSLKITNNIVKNCMVGVALVAGVDNMGVFNCVIANNTVIGERALQPTRNISNVGITLSGDSISGGYGNHVYGNSIEGFGYNTTAAEDIGGIKVQNVEDSNIYDNTIDDCIKFGINIRGFLNNGLIYSNNVKNIKSVVHGNPVYGIYFSGTNFSYIATIHDNIFTDDFNYPDAYSIAGTTVTSDTMYSLIKEYNNVKLMAHEYSRTTYLLMEKMETNPLITASRVGVEGDYIKNSAYEYGLPIGWLCTQSHENNGSGDNRALWVDVEGVRSVRTSDRPVNPPQGTMIYDREQGKPFWWHGLQQGWVEATQFKYNSGPTSERPVAPHIGEMFFDTSISEPVWYSSTGEWERVSSFGNLFGTTDVRPQNPKVGTMFFDVTLRQPIWWSSAAMWVDATGTEV